MVSADRCDGQLEGKPLQFGGLLAADVHAKHAVKSVQCPVHELMGHQLYLTKTTTGSLH